MIMAAIRHIDDTHTLVAEYCWRATMAHDSSDGEIYIDDFQTLRERVTMIRTNYQQLLMNRDYLLEVGEMHHRALREETEVDQLTHELVRTHGFLKGTQITFQESELEELLPEASQGSTTYISAESQIYTSTSSLEDVSGLIEKCQLMEEHEGYLGSLMILERCDPGDA
jgi:hypothetical protein